jgi:hypothetical protein
MPFLVPFHQMLGTRELALAARMGMDMTSCHLLAEVPLQPGEASYGLPQKQSSLVLLGRQEECPRGRAIEVGLLLRYDLA